MTPAQFIAIAAEDLARQGCVRALFLSGSHGTGLADAYSDLDFVVVCDAPLVDDLWHAVVARLGAPVLWRVRRDGLHLINAISPEWLRIDLEVIAPGQVRGLARDQVKVLFDHDGLSAGLAETPAVADPAPRVAFVIEEFIRVLGLLPVVIGRGAYLNGMAGVGLLRGLLTDLMVEETAAPHRGGALHLHRLITAAQQAVLPGLPEVRPDRASLIAAHLACASAFLPRGRRLADRLGLDWPAWFEAATWRHLRAELGIAAPGDGSGAAEQG